jgi:hypothetical protein
METSKGGERYISTYSSPRHYMAVSGQIHTQLLHPRRKSPRYIFDSRLAGPPVMVCWLWRRDTSVKPVALVGKRNSPCFYQGSRDSSVIIVTRLRAGRSIVRVPAEEGYLSFLDIVRTISGAHRAICSMGSLVFPVSKAVRA